MKTKVSFAIFIAILIIIPVEAQQQPRNILKNAISKEKLALTLLDHDQFEPVPVIGDPFWQNLDEQLRSRLIGNGEKLLGYDWPSLFARRYMDFDIDGNRTRYSSRYYERRNNLADLCLAEIVENQGRFMDDILNGTWLILEETTWVVPAHSGGDKLHDYDDVTVDLFSAETAGLLAWIDYFFGEQFDEMTPLIRKRLHAEVQRRVIQSMLDHNDFWYMGYTGRIPNNWNPWIVSNWLTAVLLLEADESRRTESVWKALDVLDNYLNPYPADGGCDEGPSYWGHAGASLFDCLFLLEDATEGSINVYDEPLIRNIGSYIYKIHIDDDWYVNFADGSAIGHHDPGQMFRIGKAIDDRTMMAMAADRYRAMDDPDALPEGRSVFGLRRIPSMMVRSELKAFNEEYRPGLNYFFPDLEVVVARETNSNKGFFMTIKGGFNNESHNHNDVGSFVIFYDGLPLFIDAGVGTYTRKTFSSERYSIWTMQSAYHNLPTINGEMQRDGNEFKAADFAYESDERSTTASMDISGAYPEYAYTSSFEREMTLDRRKGRIELTDSWSQGRLLARNQWHFIVPIEPIIEGKGTILVSNGIEELEFKFARHFEPEIERIDIEDSRLKSVWGNRIWRITLTSGKNGLRGKETFVVE